MATEKKKKAKKGTDNKIDAVRFPKIPRKRRQMPKGPHGGMELMLIEDVMHLGKQGQIVEVKPGYGRNYLLPYGLATFVSPQAKLRIERHKAKMEALRIARVAELKMYAKKLEQMELHIEERANESGELYGSVTPASISKSLAAENVNIDEKAIRTDTIKLVGMYNVEVVLSEEVTATMKVWVVPPGTKR